MLTRHGSRRATRGSNPQIREISIPDRRKLKRPKRSRSAVEERSPTQESSGLDGRCRIKIEVVDSSPPASPNHDVLYPVKQEGGVTGFARGLELAEIIGINDEDACGLRFLVRWEGCDMPEYVPATEANCRCPQQVIAFYESHCFFEVGAVR